MQVSKGRFTIQDTAHNCAEVYTDIYYRLNTSKYYTTLSIKSANCGIHVSAAAHNADLLHLETPGCQEESPLHICFPCGCYRSQESPLYVHSS